MAWGCNRKYFAPKDGNKRLKPTTVCDNGTFTRIEFSKDQQWPVPYRVNLITGDEQLLNYRQEGSALILEGVYEAFVLRYGQALLCIFNGDKVRWSEVVTEPINKVKVLTGNHIRLNESTTEPAPTPTVNPPPVASAKSEPMVEQAVTPTQTASQILETTQLKGRVYDPSSK